MLNFNCKYPLEFLYLLKNLYLSSVHWTWLEADEVQIPFPLKEGGLLGELADNPGLE